MSVALSIWPKCPDCRLKRLKDLIENGIVTPAGQSTRPYLFQLHYVLTVKTARRLRDDFQLDRNGISVSLKLLQRISELEAELNAMRARQFVRYGSEK